MKEKTKSDAMWAWMPSMPEGFDNQGWFAIHKRNIEAMIRAATTITDASVLIANKQAQMLQSFADFRPELPSAQGGANGISDAIHMQMHVARDTADKTIRQIREISDVARECGNELVDEFESCLRDNMSSVESQMGSLKPETRPTSAASPARPKAANA